MNKLHYTLGLDVGIASIGWAVVEIDFKNGHYYPKRILPLGVRLFPSAETPKTGDSLNKPRREARGLRHRLHRRKIRLHQIRELLIESELLKNKSELADASLIPWVLRVKGLDKPLENKELAKIIFHIVKRRGFKSNRKKIEDTDKDSGKMNSQIKNNIALMKEKGYRTYAEMVSKDEKFSNHIRNKGGEYVGSVSRDTLQKELELILNTQQKFGNEIVTNDFIKKCLDIFGKQKPFADKESILKMVGSCPFETDQKRAPRNSFTNESFVFWQRLNNISLINSKEYSASYAFNELERNSIYNFVLTQSEVSYKSIRKLLKLDTHIIFKSGDLTSKYGVNNLEKEATTKLKVFKGYNSIRKVFEKLDPELWDKAKIDSDYLDRVSFVLSVCKTDDELKKELSNEKFSDNEIEIILNIPTFDGFGHLSLKAINKMLPYLMKGLKYSEACEAVGYDFKLHLKNEQNTLPLIDHEEIRNPIVYRALTQSRKVINAIVATYGQPSFVHIELARELMRSRDERNKLSAMNEENRTRNEKLVKELLEYGLPDPRGKDIEKLKLWKEQNGKCAYKMRKIKIEDLISQDNMVEIDHILPFSRSLDDSMLNKVVVFSSENQNKRNQTPFEYLGGDEQSEKWQDYKTYIQNHTGLRQKKREYLLNTNFKNKDLKDFIERDLNDTKYIASYLKNFVEDNLKFGDIPINATRRVYTFTGKFTSYLRKHYGLNKDRDENSRHHALDAVMVAIASYGMLKRVSDFETVKETNENKGLKVFKKYPAPWGNGDAFRADIQARIFSDDPMEEIKKAKLEEHYKGAEEHIKPLFVSRMPRRGISGKAHAETIYSTKLYEKNHLLIHKISIFSLQKKNFENAGESNGIYGDDKELIRVLRERLEKYDWDTKKAFKEEIRKPSKNGQGNLIRTVKVMEKSNSIVPIHEGHGAAMQESMVRVDVFIKDKRYYLIPLYVADTVKKDLPNRAIVANEPYDKWISLDETYQFLFSFYSNDYVKIKLKDKELIQGYYVGTDIGRASIEIKTHDDSKNLRGKMSERPGTKTAEYIKKFNVDVLGNIYEVKNEKRHGFQIHNSKSESPSETQK